MSRAIGYMREEVEQLKAENERLRADYAALGADMRDVRDALARAFSKDNPAQIFMSATDKLERAPVLWAYERASSAVSTPNDEAGFMPASHQSTPNDE